MKFKLAVLTVAISFSTSLQAFECKTVMGGCPTDNTQITSAHMHAPVVIPAQKPVALNAATAQTPIKNSNNAAVQTVSKNTLK